MLYGINNMKMKTYSTTLPEGCKIENALSKMDYVDVFALDFKDDADVSPAEMMKLFFEVFPSWFRVLLYIREGIGRLIGLKTAHGIDLEQQFKNFKGEIGQSIALFHVLDSSKTEIMTGEDDKHLDFRLSFFAIPKNDITQMILATTVQYNGWLGRLYFFFVKPFHRLIVPVILKRMAKRLKD